MAFVPPPWYQPSYNPPLPFVAPVPGGLWPGMAVYIQGVATPQPNWFHINLATGPQEDAVGGHWVPLADTEVTMRIRVDMAMSTLEEADIALHVSPRFREGVTVFNTYRGGQWDEEERRELQPLSPGRPFEMIISVTPKGYRVLVNGSFYKEFSHRLAPEQVKAMKVKGDLELHSAAVLGAEVMGQPPTLYPPVPFNATIPEGLIPKKNIIIKGFVPTNANRFQINLRAGPGGDVVLHVNPRMDQANAVVRNSFLGGSWGQEERDIPGASPFQHGRYFDLSIRCGNDRFTAFADGQLLFYYKHRVPPGPHVNLLEIDGDVVLSYVHF